ncbi:dihydropteroate synthase [Albidovulum inexpectatum]|uniref:Dihydropteroate synthase n=1 Tax=Albidovulum inexpectatum TaxID=196587 RepID=A0A2S5JG08_9RHOB|nr:dihydropteroate synthase [Albidovulum inexpectatum]PPB80331.1 dihydropteroate synthase [Albidovulum inexpectatum]
MIYYRPIAMMDPVRPPEAVPLAGTWCWFDRVEVLSREGSQGLIRARDVPEKVLDRLTASRPPVAGMSMDAPRIMGILNVTPDSFSDGGLFDDREAALRHARAMEASGAAILDVGGESTRPGAQDVDVGEEIVRTAPVIAALREAGIDLPISIDTRKSEVAEAALRAGANMVNDVAAFAYDSRLADIVARHGVPVCLMHAQGDPATMQNDPRYDDVLLDVFDFLAERISWAEAHGIPRQRIVIDPGIGFGKTVEHNLALLHGLSLFHGLGCPILLGASRKRFIGAIGGAAEARDRGPGTIAVTLAAIAQGVQIHRVHDVAEAAQAIRLFRAVTMGGSQ